MIYLSGGVPRDMPIEIGLMLTPHKNNKPKPGQIWAADNGCFAKPEAYSDDWYLRWLDKRSVIPGCLFATAPDVMANGPKTIEKSLPMVQPIRDLGYAVALVAQNGLVPSDVPWDEFDALFIGGDTEWKLGDQASVLCAEARRRGKLVHMGRVNSYRRLRIAEERGCHSSDGTMLAFRPGLLVQLLEWKRAIDAQPQLPLWQGVVA